MSLVENVDYYIDEKTGLLVLTSHYLLKRGYCCGNRCKNCPYQDWNKKNEIKNPNVS